MAEEIVPPAYKLTLTGTGMSVAREVDQATALAVMQIIFGGRPPPAVGAAAPASPSTGPSQRLSLREVLEESGAETIPAKIVAIGRFMRDHEQHATFTRDDNKARFKTAGEPIPANFPRDFHKALRAGWVAQDHENADHFYVTRRGDEVATTRFGTEAPSPTRLRRRPQSRPKSIPNSGQGSEV